MVEGGVAEAVVVEHSHENKFIGRAASPEEAVARCDYLGQIAATDPAAALAMARVSTLDLNELMAKADQRLENSSNKPESIPTPEPEMAAVRVAERPVEVAATARVIEQPAAAADPYISESLAAVTSVEPAQEKQPDEATVADPELPPAAIIIAPKAAVKPPVEKAAIIAPQVAAPVAMPIQETVPKAKPVITLEVPAVVEVAVTQNEPLNVETEFVAELAPETTVVPPDIITEETVIMWPEEVDSDIDVLEEAEMVPSDGVVAVSETVENEFSAEVIETYIVLAAQIAEAETAETKEVPDFETFIEVMVQPEREEPLTVEVIHEQAEMEQPLEETLVQLVELLSDPELMEQDQLEEIRQIISEIEEILPNCYVDHANQEQKPIITPELTEKLVAFLTLLGYQQPRETLTRFVDKYDLVFLLEGLEYMSRINQQIDHKERLRIFRSRTSKRTPKLVLSKALFGLISSVLILT